MNAGVDLGNKAEPTPKTEVGWRTKMLRFETSIVDGLAPKRNEDDAKECFLS